MKTTYLYIGVIVLIFGGLIAARNMADSEVPEASTTKFDEFAQCITDAGAKFYGAWWCPHCNEQKELFENSKKLPYTECSTPNKQPLQVCIEAGVEAFPTWIFSDGTKLEGLQEFSVLGAKTKCAVPAA